MFVMIMTRVPSTTTWTNIIQLMYRVHIKLRYNSVTVRTSRASAYVTLGTRYSCTRKISTPHFIGNINTLTFLPHTLTSGLTGSSFPLVLYSVVATHRTISVLYQSFKPTSQPTTLGYNNLLSLI